MITGIQDFYYNVADMKRAVHFYCDVLGMTVTESDDAWTSLSCGGIRIGLHGHEGHHAVPFIRRDAHGAHAGGTLTLKSDDINGDVERLRDAGVRFLGEITHDPWGSLVSFEDSEGNVLKLMQSPQ